MCTRNVCQRSNRASKRNEYQGNEGVADADEPLNGNSADGFLRHYQNVYAVSTTFSTCDSPLFSPLLTSSTRSQALRAHGGHWVYRAGQDHSMQTCGQDF